MKKLSKIFMKNKENRPKNKTKDARNMKKKRGSLDQHVKEFVDDPSEKFNDITRVASGTFGKVFSACDKKTGQVLALKRINLKNSLRDRLTKEIEYMGMIRHKSVVQLFSVFQTRKHIYLVMEYISGGELFDWVIDRENKIMDSQAAYITKQILSGLEYMHAHSVTHRDIKLENILCASNTADYPTVKIADFGLSVIFDKRGGGKLNTQCGSPEYIAPEVISLGEYDEKADMWSVGVITYVLLTGCFPFGCGLKNNIILLFEAIRTCDYDWIGSNVSAPAKRFVSKLLEADSGKRYSAKEASHDEWFARATKNTEGEIWVQEILKSF